MNPEKYLKEYLRPLTAGKEASTPPAPAADGYMTPGEASSNGGHMTAGELPFLPREHYYSDHEPSHYIYNFTLDKLTRAELLRVIRKMSPDAPENLTPGQLLGWIAEKDRVSGERAALLVARERELSELHALLDAREQELAGFRKTAQSPSYRAYRALILPLKAVRRLYRFIRPRPGDTRRQGTGPGD